MSGEKSKERIVKALLEHSRKHGKPLSEADIVKGMQELYLKLGEGAIPRYRGNIPLLAEDIRAALKAQERAGGLRPILVRGSIRLVPAGRRVITPLKVAPGLPKRKGIMKRLA